MKRIAIALMVLLTVLAVAGCGGGHDRELVTARIVSDPLADGDIAQLGSTFTINQNVASIFAGEDPGNLEDFRAFLTFPLASIPGTARIQAATLDIVVRSVTVLPTNAEIPVRVELVTYPRPPGTLSPVDFNKPALIATSIVTAITSADVNHSVPIDVTPLMDAAQQIPLSHLQLRITADFGAVPGLIEIDDDVDPPLLFVDYF